MAESKKVRATVRTTKKTTEKSKQQSELVKIIEKETPAFPKTETSSDPIVSSKKKILFVASEARPFIATGGLADVIGSLPQALAQDPIYDIRVV